MTRQHSSRSSAQSEPTLSPVVYDAHYESKSGREWIVISRASIMGKVTVMPIGPGTGGGANRGGVVCRQAWVDDLAHERNGWRFVGLRR